jgi:peptide/nickel transport system substrate-binding protein
MSVNKAFTYGLSQSKPRPWNRRQAFVLALGSAGAVAFGAACGSRRGGKPAPSADAQNGKPKSGGQLNLATVDDPGNGGSFDPANKRTAGTFLLAMTNNSLLGFRTGPHVKFTDVSIQPELADRWETPDAATYTFHLHPTVPFADVPPVNGRQMTSADVKWSYEYLSRTGAMKGLPAAGTASFFTGLDAVETPDPQTVVVRFKDPFAPFLTYAATRFVPVVAHEIYDQDGSFAKRLAGTGPFQLDVAGSQPGKRWVWKKNPTYFQRGLLYLDQINWLVVADVATQEAAFEARQIDLLAYSGLNLDAARRVQKAAPSVVASEYLDPREPYVYMNVSKPPLSDARIRQAISLAIDRDAFVKTFSQGKGQWALAASLPGVFSEDETKQILKYDPAKAKQLVGEAGGGADVQFMYTAYSSTYSSILQLFQAQLKPAGINVALQQVESGVDSERRRSGDYQLAVTPGPPGLTPDMDSILYPLFYPNDPGNRGLVNDSELTPLLVAERREADPTKRKQTIRQAVRRINEVPWAVALYYDAGYELWQPYLKNYAPNLALDQWVNNSWLDK